MLPEVVASDHSRSLTLRSILPNEEKPAATATPQPAKSKSSPAVTPLDSPGGGGGGAPAGQDGTPQATSGGGGGGGNVLTKGLRSAKAKSKHAHAIDRSL